MSRTFVGVGLVLCAGVALGEELAQAPLPRLIPLEELVKQLGSEDFQEREAASKRFHNLALDPPPQLLAALKSDNAEVRDRAAKAIQAMRRNVAIARLPRGQRFVEQNRVDLFVGATAAWNFSDEDSRLWEPAHEFGKRVFEKAEMAERIGGQRGLPANCPAAFADFSSYVKKASPRFTRTDVPFAGEGIRRNESIHALGVAAPLALYQGIIVSRGSVETKQGIWACVILANGDVTAVSGLAESVVVCDGDVTITGSAIITSLVIARGNITAKKGTNRSFLAAGGKISLGGDPLLKTLGNVFTENAVNPLGITFFELSTVGVEVKPAKEVVQVSAVGKGKAFAKAGVQVGDTILTVEGKKPDSAESLRRLLRDALAIGDATITLRRGEKTETVKVSLPE